jgi:hypothetical protein
MNYFDKPAGVLPNISKVTSAFGQNESFADKAKSFFSGYMVLLVAVLVVFIILVIYHRTIGYYVKVGWKRIQRMMGFGTEVDVTFGPGDADNEPDPGVIATVAPITSDGPGGFAPNGPGDVPPASPMLPPDDRPTGMPGASSSSSLFDSLSDAMPHGNEVFNISRNVYTFHDAAAVCAAANAELASYDQVKDAYDKGADWCNYGWIKGQMAVYPTQKETYEKLQKGAPEFRNACGVPGVNGGHFDNPELRFGVNCYGKKPVKKASDELIESQVALPASPEEIEFDKQVQKFREQMDATTILPFSKGRWTA